MAKMRSRRARRLIRRQGGVAPRRASARIHLHRHFPSWSPRYIHSSKVPLHNKVGFSHCFGEIPGRRPVSEKRRRPYQRFRRHGFSATRQNPIGMQKPCHIVHPRRALGRTPAHLLPHDAGKRRRHAPSTPTRIHILSNKLTIAHVRCAISKLLRNKTSDLKKFFVLQAL